MSRLKPGATYIYENADGVIYAREFNAPANTRVEIGRIFGTDSLHDSLPEDKLWGEIRQAARTNPALQEALDRAIIIYQLSRENDR